MSKFQPGDRVRHTRDHSDTATILAVHEGLYWMLYDDDGWPFTTPVEVDADFELIPEPFLPDGDRYYNVYTDGYVSVPYSSLAAAEYAYNGPSNPKLGIIRIDGQTGAPSWAKGGPQ